MGLKRKIQGVLALSPMQHGILFHSIQNKTPDEYFEQLCLNIHNKIDLIAFKKA